MSGPPALTLSRIANVMTFVLWLGALFLPLVSGPLPALILTSVPLALSLAWAGWLRSRLAPPERAAVRTLLRYDPAVWLSVRWTLATAALLLTWGGLAAVRITRYEPAMWIMFAVALGWAVVYVASLNSAGRPLSVPAVTGDPVLSLELRWFRATALLTFVPWSLSAAPAPWSERAGTGSVVLALLGGYFLVSWLRSRARAVRRSSAVVEVLVGASPASTAALLAFILAAAYLPWQMPDWAMVPVFIVTAVAWLWLPLGVLHWLWRLAGHIAGRPGRRVAGSVVPRR